jgi:hypothetical protein
MKKSQKAATTGLAQQNSFGPTFFHKNPNFSFMGRIEKK